MFGPCRNVGPISEEFIVCHYNPPHNDRAYNNFTMNFTMIMSQFSCTSCGPIGKIILFEVAGTYQSYRASECSDAWGALLVHTLLPGALDSYRDRINSLFFRIVSIWVFPQMNISLSSGIYSRIPANTLLITSTFFI